MGKNNLFKRGDERVSTPDQPPKISNTNDKRFQLLCALIASGRFEPSMSNIETVYEKIVNPIVEKYGG